MSKKERASKRARGGLEGERETQADSRLSVEPDAGLDLTTLGSQAEPNQESDA